MVTTYIKAYIIGIESWNSYVRLTACLYSTIAWNNTVNFLGKPTFEAYMDHNTYIRNNILANISSILQEDLGDLQENYTAMFTKVRKPSSNNQGKFL